MGGDEGVGGRERGAWGEVGGVGEGVGGGVVEGVVPGGVQRGGVTGGVGDGDVGQVGVAVVVGCGDRFGHRSQHMRVPGDHLLVENDALGKAGIYFRPGKIIQAAKNLGVGVRAFEVTSDYVQSYVQGGRILIKHQAVALRLADMATRIEAVRALLDRASLAVDENAPDADTLCNMVKVFASEEIMKVAQHAVELHGGNGMMLDFGVEKLLRDAAIFLHMDATVDISKLKIVKSLFPHSAGKYAGPE